MWDLIGTVARVGLAAVFLISGGVKAADPDQTYVAVKAYQVLPKAAVEPVAIVLPWFELALGLLLVLGVGTRIVALLSAGLLVLFMAGVAQAWARGLSIDCGCFGGGGDVTAEQTSYGTELLRDAGFLVPAVWLIIRPASWLSLDRWLGRNDGVGPAGGGIET
ncbi:MAG: MauE/DoxX family redox-associated membrane protein [Pseudonocardia sp.]